MCYFFTPSAQLVILLIAIYAIFILIGQKKFSQKGATISLNSASSNKSTDLLFSKRQVIKTKI